MTSIQKFLTVLWGIVHGTVGTIWGLAGCFLAFPIDSAPGTKEWAEDCQFIPLGYIMLAIWLMATLFSYFHLRKSKTGILVFTGAWVGGVLLFIVALLFWSRMSGRL